MNSKRRPQKRRGTATASDVPESTLSTEAESCDLGVGKRVADDFLAAHATSVTSDREVALIPTADTGERFIAPTVSEPQHIEPPSAEEPDIVAASSWGQYGEEVRRRPEKYAESQWALIDKHFGWLLREIGVFSPLLGWVVVAAWMTIDDNEKQLLSSAEGRKNCLVTSLMPLTFFLSLYFPIFLIQKQWGVARKVISMLILLGVIMALSWLWL